ncbi:MAG: dihydropteridine reductase [Clostridia bacterium]|nr:dihydropteridine reductase [Clostridia bacterium]
MNAIEAKNVEHIRNQYTAKETTKLDELRALDRQVKRPVTVFSYIFGTIGSLVLGTGMCLAMKVIGDMMTVGIAVGLAGIVLCGLTYPIYKGILKARKKKYAEKILALSDSILNQ